MASWRSRRPISPRPAEDHDPRVGMHGDDDQIVPYADSGPLSAELLTNGTLKTYPGYAHGAFTTHAASSNA